MRLVLLVMVIIAGVYFYVKLPTLSRIKNNNILNATVKKSEVSGGDVLGTTSRTVQNTVSQIVPSQVLEKVITDTAADVIGNVQNDMNKAISQTVNNVLAGQLVNNFKNLPQPVQEQVKKDICK